MILFITVALLPVLLAQKDLPCDSCCPPPSAPDGDAVSCSNLSDKIQMLQNAINLSSCGKDSGSSSADDAGVCMTVTMQAIPPCMLKEGSTAQSQCLIEAAKAISKELPGADEASGLEIVKKCKCDAFRKMWKNLVNVKEMICVDDYVRGGKNYQQPGHGGQVAHYPAQYGANTLWFQYAMCQGQDFSCYFFTNNWNQGDFGQYYLYDNLLGDGNLLGGDNSLLPILALTSGLGGHGGGLGGLLPLALLGGLGGDRTRREAVEECVPGEVGCPSQRRRRAAAEDCVPGDKDCPTDTTDRRRRAAAVDCVPGDEGCPTVTTDRRRRAAAVDCVPGDEGCPTVTTDRRRRAAAWTVSQVTRVVPLLPLIGGVVRLLWTVSQVTRVVPLLPLIGGVVRLLWTVSQVTRVVPLIPLIGGVVMLKSLAAVIMTVVMATPVREPMLTSVAYVGGYNWLLSGLDICVIYFGSNSDV